MLAMICMSPSNPKDRKFTPMSLCHYEDADNGITPAIHMCRECYAEHITKFYPASRVALHIQQFPGEWTNS